MKKKENTEDLPDLQEEDLPGYPSYPDNEDIYKTDKEMSDLDPDDPSKTKTPDTAPDEPNDIDSDRIRTGDDLDVPGSELDDELENIGEEDEENNYYSLGGDNHEDLEEDKGD